MKTIVNQKIKLGSLEQHAKELIEISENKKVFILCDNNTEQCVNYLKNKISIFRNAGTYTIKSGEKFKTLKTSQEIWDFLITKKANRNDLLINVGGGLISDIGGFVASTYKRGIQFINIPTSLLGMIDASIGGKTGVNFNGIKNQIGLFNNPEIILCDPYFLKTLPKDEFLSGLAEVLKHGLIHSREHWDYCSSLEIDKLDILKIINDSISIKTKIVCIDPHEKKERKLLNFGHTIGHAIESLLIQKHKQTLHGFAVASGIIIESFISLELNHLKEEDYIEIKKTINETFPKLTFIKSEIPALIELMKTDKKNNSDEINFTLIDEIGHGIVNQNINTSQLKLILEKYLEIS
jgi:3-dehydroquinate synthase